jgi:hypothetical protein
MLRKLILKIWLAVGSKMNFMGAITCYTHDGPVLTGSEELEFEEGNDPCITIMRIW